MCLCGQGPSFYKSHRKVWMLFWLTSHPSSNTGTGTWDKRAALCQTHNNRGLAETENCLMTKQNHKGLSLGLRQALKCTSQHKCHFDLHMKSAVDIASRKGDFTRLQASIHTMYGNTLPTKSIAMDQYRFSMTDS